MYNWTLVNASDPVVLARSVNEVFFMGALFEILLIFIFFICYTGFYFSTRGSTIKSLVYSTFVNLIFSLFFVGLKFITARSVFFCVAFYGITLFIAYNMPDN